MLIGHRELKRQAKAPWAAGVGVEVVGDLAHHCVDLEFDVGGKGFASNTAEVAE